MRAGQQCSSGCGSGLWQVGKDLAAAVLNGARCRGLNERRNGAAVGGWWHRGGRGGQERAGSVGAGREQTGRRAEGAGVVRLGGGGRRLGYGALDIIAIGR